MTRKQVDPTSRAETSAGASSTPGATGRPAYAPKLGLSVAFKPDASPEELAAKLAEYGFVSAELHLSYLERCGDDAIRPLAGALEHLTFHLPADADYHALCADASRDALALEMHRRLIARAAGLGCRTFVLHVENICGQRLADFWDRSVDFARKMGDVAAAHGSVIGVENCYPVMRDGPTAARFLDAVGHGAVGMNLDCGHFWSALCEDEYGRYLANPLMKTDAGVREMHRMLLEAARAVGPRIVNIHIHDIRADDWLDHQPLSRGVMRYGEFFGVLRGIGYDRPLTVEIRPTGGDWSGFEISARALRELV